MFNKNPKKHAPSPPDFSLLPDEVWLEILRHLDSEPLNRTALVNRKLNNVTQDKKLLISFSRLGEWLIKTLARFYVQESKEDNKNEKLMDDLTRLQCDIRQICTGEIIEGVNYFGLDHRKNMSIDQINRLIRDLKNSVSNEFLEKRKPSETTQNLIEEESKINNYLTYPFPFSICECPVVSINFAYPIHGTRGKASKDSAADSHMRLLFRLCNELAYSQRQKNDEYNKILENLIGVQLLFLEPKTLETCRKAMVDSLKAAKIVIDTCKDNTKKSSFLATSIGLHNVLKRIEEKLGLSERFNPGLPQLYGPEPKPSSQ